MFLRGEFFIFFALKKGGKMSITRTATIESGHGALQRTSTIECANVPVERVLGKRKREEESRTDEVATSVLNRSVSLPAASNRSSHSSRQTASQPMDEDPLDPNIPWQVGVRPVGLSKIEMRENTAKALQEHKDKDKMDRSVYPCSSQIRKKTLEGLALEHEVSAKQGRRATMEDAHLFEEIEGGYLAGIFDGHGGKKVADAAAQRFPKVFPRALEKKSGDIQAAFYTTFQEIQKGIAKRKDCLFMGSTAVVSYIQKNGEIYTATVGDSEAFLYRTDEKGDLLSIPLSVVRDWSHPEEVQRVLGMAKTPQERQNIERWRNYPEPKRLRVGNGKGMGLNVSHALGDFSYPQVNPKPIVTVQQWKRGDRLGLFCDGVVDFASQREIVETIKDHPVQTAGKIADFALRYKRSTDNISAMMVKEKELG